MIKRFKPPAAGKLADPETERIRQVTDERIGELQGVPIVSGKLIRGIALEAGIETPVSHGLGRRATLLTSPPRLGRAEILVPAAAMSPVAAGSWFHPNGTQDYWLTNDVDLRLEIPFTGLIAGQRITQVALSYYRTTAAEPAVAVGGALTAASMSATSPTDSWSTSTLNTWSVIAAPFDVVATRGNWKAWVDCPGNGDRVRGCYVTVEGGMTAIEEIRSTSHDPTKVVVLRSSTDCTVDAWVF